MLETALLFDSNGKPIRQDHRTRSQDWGEVQAFCREVYMPYKVTPLGKMLKPDATMYGAKVARITVTRFAYGVPVHLSEFDPGAGNILVLNTLRGHLRHMVDANHTSITEKGESFVADCSRTDYWLDGDALHMQLNLTIPHAVMEEIARRWYGFVPDNRLWTTKLKFGSPHSAWMALMDYMAHSIAADPEKVAKDRIGFHLEEMICIELLRTWAQGAGINLDHGAREAAPHYVRTAELFMESHAHDAPTMGEVARAAGVSVRSLTEGFRKFRGLSPSQFLRERRLDGVRQTLLAAADDETVSSIASNWGYVNFGLFAGLYRRRFGERPSDTLARARK